MPYQQASAAVHAQPQKYLNILVIFFEQAVTGGPSGYTPELSAVGACFCRPVTVC